MKKIVCLPLDERPCNYVFPRIMQEEYYVAVPDEKVMGDKKKPADFGGISAFLKENLSEAIGLWVSLDMLLYGGIVPSRLHHKSEAELTKRLSLLKEIRKEYPALPIYAFSLIMRCPSYSSDDEEPSYYGICGKMIFEFGVLTDKKERGLPVDEKRLDELKKITEQYLPDYIARRKINLAMNKKAVSLVGDVIDFLAFPQDDSAEYGFSAKDRQSLNAFLKSSHTPAAVYCGADEAGMALTARLIAANKKVCPKIRVFYSSECGKNIIPLYECDQTFVTVTRQIQTCGAAETDFDADIYLFVNSPSPELINANITNNGTIYPSGRNLHAFLDEAEKHIANNEIVVFADIAYVNGGDVEFAELLSSKKLALKASCYSGWNTASNTIGTAVAAGVLEYACKRSGTSERFAALRYYEDVGYAAYARKKLCDEFLLPLHLNYFDSGDKRGVVSNEAKITVSKFMSEKMPDVYQKYEITDCYMPWKRMFEIGLTVAERRKR